MVEFRGIWPALVTPLDATGRVDVEAAGKLIEALLQAGIGGLYVLGGAGEGVLLSRGVRHEMAEVVMAAVGGRVPVMVHVDPDTGCLRAAGDPAAGRHAAGLTP